MQASNTGLTFIDTQAHILAHAWIRDNIYAAQVPPKAQNNLEVKRFFLGDMGSSTLVY